MLDTRAASIIYQAQGYLVELVAGTDTLNEKVSLIAKRKFGKALNKDWDRADMILSYLEAWEEVDKLDDKTQFNYVLEKLIDLCKLNQFPTAPTITSVTPPAILYGLPGDAGATGAQGIQGETGLATDFQVSLISVPTVLDSFDVADAVAARWDYTVIKSTGEQRSGSVVGTWLDDGSELALDPGFSTPDIGGVGDTADLTFDLQFNAGNIELLAVPAAGQWQVIGTRYFIPNNGNGSGPIGDVLADGKIYIGNASNVATAQTVSGVIAITNTGVTSYVAGSIVNAAISGTAAIAYSKLVALTADRIAGTDGSGFLTFLDTATYPSLTELSYVKGASSSLQTQITAKLTDPMTTIGDIIIRDGTNTTVRLPIGTAAQVLTVAGGVPTWAAVPGGISGLTTGVIPKAASATTINDSIMSQSGTEIIITGTVEAQGGLRTNTVGPYLKLITYDIDDWNMDSTTSVTIAHGLTYSKIRGILNISIRRDDDSSLDQAPGGIGTTTDGLVDIFSTVGATDIFIGRRTGGGYDGADYNSTGFNRGFVTILYEA